MVTEQRMCVYDYWVSWARDVCVWLLGKGCVCMITGQLGKGCLCVVTGQGMPVYDYRAREVYVCLLGKLENGCL